MPTVLSINVGKLRPFEDSPDQVSAIWKAPVQGLVTFGPEGPEGDEHRRPIHGGEFQAVYSYSAEDYAWWSGQLGRPLPPGAFGENLTIEGLDHSAVLSGEVWRVGSVLIEATHPRLPCATFQCRMGEDRWIERFSDAMRCGVYWRVAQSGTASAGDSAEPVSRPDHGMTVAEMFKIRVFEPARKAEILCLPRLSEKWRTWAEGH